LSAATEICGQTLYFDCFAGVAGDMLLGALVDLGVPEEVIRAELGKLALPGWQLRFERVQRGALFGTKAWVDVHDGHHHDEHGHHHDEHGHHDEHRHRDEHRHHDEHLHPDEHHHDHAEDGPHHAHRHYREIRQLLVGALTGDVLRRTLDIFDRIAVVEARLHGVTVEDVAFHEVGAVDSIVDIVGTAAALSWLRPARVVSRPVALGGGMVHTAHGRLPVPAPATLELLHGLPVEAGGDYELTTPTGAAVIAATVTEFGPLPPMSLVAVGWGAGTRQLPDRPNLLRVVVGSASGRVNGSLSDEVTVIEANLDDMNPELCEPLTEALFAAGALDVWLTPIVMKKGRPAIAVAAMAPIGRKDAVILALLAESTTIGVRHHLVARTTLPRKLVDVETPFGKIPVKVAGEGGPGPDGAWNVAPEYAACVAAGRSHGVPVKLVYSAAIAAFFRR